MFVAALLAVVLVYAAAERTALAQSECAAPPAPSVGPNRANRNADTKPGDIARHWPSLGPKR